MKIEEEKSILNLLSDITIQILYTKNREVKIPRFMEQYLLYYKLYNKVRETLHKC